MTYSIPALIAYNLSELRRHMRNAGATEQQWFEGLLAESTESLSRQHRPSEIDPENLEPYGPQNHPLP